MTALDDGIYTEDEELKEEIEPGTELDEGIEQDIGAGEPPPYAPDEEDKND